MDQQAIYALATLAGWKNCGYEKIENGYWPKHPDYDHMRELHPWWRVSTEFGTVIVGWRKKVIQINWIETNRRGEVTKDDVTKDDTMVHAWDIGKAVTYMRAIQSLPVVDITLPEFKYYDCTKFDDIDMLIRRFSDVTTVEHTLMVQILDTVDREVTPVRLTIASRNGVTTKDRFVLHVGDLRIEWMTKRNI